MARRTVWAEEIPAPKPRLVEQHMYTCDGCAAPVTRDDQGGGYAHELEIYLDDGQCVSFRRRRDYCPACLNPIWKKIHELIGGDPELDGDDVGEDDDELPEGEAEKPRRAVRPVAPGRSSNAGGAGSGTARGATLMFMRSPARTGCSNREGRDTGPSPVLQGGAWQAICAPLPHAGLVISG